MFDDILCSFSRSGKDKNHWDVVVKTICSLIADPDADAKAVAVDCTWSA